MADLIENPVINSPFGEPQRHFRFDENGITHEILIGRRLSTYFIPIAKPKLLDRLKQANAEETLNGHLALPWIALKMATGSGKTHHDFQGEQHGESQDGTEK